ncbi:hypothetical protein [Actinomyces gaoshouyii]|uniref:Uncharacterized protein n=1 Tax=Actinomyces gaoshouyii TaxID=1960083 RepID=A0A8H9H6U7_9ACTO|nr:hypothetical protein [Actinomyces gaoshouyii]GGO95325.1 hypothetical protein GCM10011612_02900 [Actinomyces gaoshouyii]
MKENAFDRIELETNSLALMSQDAAWYWRGDEERVFTTVPAELAFLVGDLHKFQVLPDRGGWTWARLRMDASEWVLHSEFDWMREPHFDPPFEYIPADCAAELDLRPRSAEWIPEWMAAGIARQERHQAALARRRQRDRARRAAKRAEKEAKEAQQAEVADQEGDGSTPTR